MIEFYNIIASQGQSVIDVSIQEYGSIDGVALLVEDNSLDSFTHEFDGGEVLNIRVTPDIAPEIIEYTRRGREFNIIQIEGGSGDCPTLLELIVSTATSSIYSDLETATKLDDVTQLIPNEELENNLSSGQVEYLVGIKTGIAQNIIYG
jgi:hypothetical protein